MDAPPVQYVTTRDGFDIAYGLSGFGPLVIPPGASAHVELSGRYQDSATLTRTMGGAASRSRGIT
jgi:hypothetical protein